MFKRSIRALANLSLAALAGTAQAVDVTVSAAASLTNAFKHAPGAPVDVVITGGSELVEIDVTNGRPAGPLSGLERAGSGRGLAGMRERVAACGGEVRAGPVEGGGWQVFARLPRQPGQARASSLT